MSAANLNDERDAFDIHETTEGRERIYVDESFDKARRWIAGVVGIDPDASPDRGDVIRMEIPGEVWHFEHDGRTFEVEHLRDDDERKPGAWLLEWDGGWATADSEAEAWRKVAVLISNDDAGATVEDFTVRPNLGYMDAVKILPGDVVALIAATFSRDADTIEAEDETWSKLREIFPASLAPAPGDEYGITRVEVQP